MASRQEALEQIAGIARDHGLTAAEIAARLGKADGGEPPPRNLLGRILGYLGGTFILAGLGVFIALNWVVMTTAARIIITLGSGVTAFVMALVAAADRRYTAVKTPLYLVAAALQPTGILVAIDEFSAAGDWHHAALVTAAVMALQQGAVFWQKRDTTLLFTSILFSLWFFGVLLDLVDADGEIIALILGLSTLSLCVGLERTPHRGVTPFWYLVGAALLFMGLFELLEHTALEPVFVAAACGGVFLSTAVSSRTLLFASILAILAYISYFTQEHFLDSLGWPLALILLGLACILLSAIAIRINRRYISNPGSNPGSIPGKHADQ